MRRRLLNVDEKAVLDRLRCSPRWNYPHYSQPESRMAKVRASALAADELTIEWAGPTRPSAAAIDTKRTIRSPLRVNDGCTRIISVPILAP